MSELFYLFLILKNSKTTVGGRYVEVVLQKLPSDSKYWPHLTKEKKKYHWLKVDFKKWKDEDDSDDEVVSGAGGMGGDANIDDVCKIWYRQMGDFINNVIFVLLCVRCLT